jgi:hypothetical protein
MGCWFAGMLGIPTVCLGKLFARLGLGRGRFVVAAMVESLRLGIMPMRSKSHDKHTSLGGFRLGLFGLAPSREACFLTPKVRTGFQFVVLTGVAVEEDNRLRVFVLRHGVLPSALSATSIALAFWLSGAEAPASSVASASCYSCAKNVCVLAIVVPELELREVQRQVFLTDMVVVANDSALQEAPKVLDIVRMNLAAYILASAVADCFVREAYRVQMGIATPFIGRYKVDFVAHSLAHEAIEGHGVRLLDNLADYVALPRDGSDHCSFSAQASDVLPFIPVAILVFTVDAGFVDFDDAHELREFSVLHRSPESMAEIPRGRIGRSNLALDLFRADAFLRVQDAPQNLEPRAERIVSVLENRPCDDREAIARFAALGALPVPRTPLQVVNLIIPATRAFHNAIQPTAIFQILFAGVFVRKRRHQFTQGHHAMKNSSDLKLCQVLDNYP